MLYNIGEDHTDFESNWNSFDWIDYHIAPAPGQKCLIKGHWFTSNKRHIYGVFKYDADEGWNDEVNNSFMIDGWKPKEDTDELYIK